MANTITRKALSDIVLYVTENGCTIWDAADALGFDPEGTRQAVADFHASTHRPRKSKPSAETIANRKLAEDVAAEVNARGIEVTAKDVAEYAVDNEGNAMSTRKVGGLLKQAADRGLIEKSPENWPVAHYAPCGFAFAPKPERKRRKKSEDTPEE